MDSLVNRLHWLRSLYCCRRHDLQRHMAGRCTDSEDELTKLGLVTPKRNTMDSIDLLDKEILKEVDQMKKEMTSKYDTMPLNQNFLRNLHLLARSIPPNERLEQIGFYTHHAEKVKLMCWKNGTDRDSMAAMVATLAPGIRLEKAEEYAQQIASELRSGKSVDELTLLGAYGWRNIRQSAAIWFNGPKLISGQKTEHLYTCLIDPQNISWCPLGRNEKRALSQDFDSPDDAFKISKVEYGWILRHYSIVAAQLELSMCELQAIVAFVVIHTMARNRQTLKVGD